MPVGMELHELHVLERQSCAQRHGVAVASAGVGRGRREVGAAVAAGRQDHHVGAEEMERAIVKVPGEHALACPLLVHHEVEGKILDEERRLVAE